MSIDTALIQFSVEILQRKCQINNVEKGKDLLSLADLRMLTTVREIWINAEH